jgi:hypothetical protein
LSLGRNSVKIILVCGYNGNEVVTSLTYCYKDQRVKSSSYLVQRDGKNIGISFASSGSTAGRSINYRSYVFGVKSSCGIAPVESQVEKNVGLSFDSSYSTVSRAPIAECNIKGSNPAAALHIKETG